ncbi:MAG: hypothetical protein K0R54_3059 [Clostridiaceae bacterium]|jgi:MFS family permease|nr:hypothetical protein [Clostridiaceae bacterium]
MNLNVKVTSRSNQNLLLIGRFISLFGTKIYSFAMALFVLKSTGSAGPFIITLLVGNLPKAILAPFAGVLADRFKRKKIVVSMDFISAVIIFILLGISFVDNLRVEYIYIVAFLLSVCETFFDVSLNAGVPAIVDDKDLMKLNSLNQAITSFATIIGSIFGGIIYGIFDIRSFLVVNACSFIISGLLESLVNFEYNKEKSKQCNTKFHLKSDFNEVVCFMKKSPALLSLFKFSLFLNFFITLGLIVPYPYILNNILEFSTSQIGSINAMLPMGMMFGAICISYKKNDKRKYKMILVGMIILSSLLIFFSLPYFLNINETNKTVIFIYYLIIMFVLGNAVMVVNIPINVIMQEIIPDQLRGRVLGVIQTIITIVGPFAMIVAGILLNETNGFLLPFISGIFLIIFSIIMTMNENIRLL